MSDKAEVGELCDEDTDKETARNTPVENLDHQYSRDQLFRISKSPAALTRHSCLDRAYDSKDGCWDPDLWWRANFGSRESSPLTLSDGKERRRIPDLDLKRKSLNDPVERLKDERDGIVLSPQRRSFVTGCHVQQTLSYTRQSSLSERDREDPRSERDRDRDRDRGDRDRDRRKIGSGRIQIDRDGSRDYTNLRDRYGDRDRDREHPWNRDRLDREWERDRDPREADWERDKDRRFDRDRLERFRRSDSSFSDRDRRERDFRDRDRDRFDRSDRRRNNYSRQDEKQPEWFTGGPTSQNDTIELRGFEKEGDQENRSFDKPVKDINKEAVKRHGKGSGEKSEDFVKTSDGGTKGSQRSTPLEDNVFAAPQPPKGSDEAEPGQPSSLTPQEPGQRVSSNAGVNKLFDFDEILKADLPLEEDSERQSSRFSRFFPELTGKSFNSPMPEILMPHGLLEDSNSSPGPHQLPYVHMGQISAPDQAHYLQRCSPGMIHKDGLLPHSATMSVPNSAGDNNAHKSLPPSVTALFNSAAAASSNACISSNGTFSTQDAEAQLKAMLLGGPKDSASSSGTASPASLPPSLQNRIKTVAELEADMHQNSPQKARSPASFRSTVPEESPQNRGAGDMTAFNKLLIMMNAGSEASKKASNVEPGTNAQVGFGMLPGHSEFNHALMRNKEHQRQLLQQSLMGNQQMPPGSMGPQGQKTSLEQALRNHQHQGPPMVMGSMPHQSLQPPPPGQPPGPGIPTVMGMEPQAMSTPQAHIVTSNKPRMMRTSGAEPILNFIQQNQAIVQQNPAIIMKSASPAPGMATILASQQSAVASTARVPSPLMFSQQPPLHLSAPSPIHPSQLSPRSLTTSSGGRSPVHQPVPSPQELSAHAQAIMHNALIKKQLQDQNERYIKKQQEREKSPCQPVNIVKQPPAAQQVLPPTPQPKGASLNTFTPTSVLRKMHSDRVEKEKQAQEGGSEEPTEFMPSMQEMSAIKPASENHNTVDNLNVDVEGNYRPGTKLVGDVSDISFLDPVNPNLVTVNNSYDNNLRHNSGQSNILPGSLSQPMSVEEKMKLSALVENPGILSQILESKAAADAVKSGNNFQGGQGRPIVRSASEMAPHEENTAHLHLQQQQIQQHFQQVHHQQQIQQQQQQAQQQQQQQALTMQQQQLPQYGMPRPVGQFGSQGGLPPSSGKHVSGRAIVGNTSVQQQHGHGLPPQMPLSMQMQGNPAPPQPPPAINSGTTGAEMMQLLEQQQKQHQQQQFQQQFQRTQQLHSPGGMGLPPPLIPCVGMSRVGMMPPFPRPTPILRAQQGRQIPYMASQQPQQPHQQRSLSSMSQAMPTISSGPHSPRGQTSGSLSPAALTATIQRVASPHGGIKMNGPMPMSSSAMNGSGSKIDFSAGIQRWFSPDILKTQLPSMPPLPTQGSHVMTVDELERN